MESLLSLDHSNTTTETFNLFLDFRVLVLITALLVIALHLYFNTKQVYLLDFICYKAPETHRVPISVFIEHIRLGEKFNSDIIEFQSKVIERSGIGGETYLPSGTRSLPPDRTLNSTLEEVEMVLFTIVQDLFTKHNIDPQSIDILITNCSLVCPTPSLSAMIINKFKFKSSVKSFNLSGMGCSAGLLSISLARDLLKVHKNSLALILSMESVCSNMYYGNIKSMLLANCLFRMGGAAILLSNRKRDKTTAKYQLQHLVRTNLASKDGSYKCVVQQHDEKGHKGVSLSRSILQVASEALKTNLTTLATLALPYSEQIQYGLSVAWKSIWPPAKKRVNYIPNFRKAFNHFCIHAGGKAVIDAVKESLKLRDRDVEASKMTLYRFGNTSSSSTWYSLSYLEAKGRIRRGNKIWQLTFGSGFKCNSAVWKCISEPKPECTNVWSDRIDQYPIEVPEVMDH